MRNNSQESNQRSRREYRSEKRRKQASDTRQTIIDAGRRLFIEQGYASTTVAEIAKEAGVSAPTVYASVGGKRGILMALVEYVDQLGDEEIGPQLEAETDPVQIIQFAMKYNRQVLERGGDIIELLFSTASLDNDVAEILEEAKNTNRKVAGELASYLMQYSTLQPHLTLEQVGDIISVVLWPTPYEMLRSYGWTWDECERWSAETLVKLLLVLD